MAWDLGYMKLILELDSEVVVHILESNREARNWRMASLHDIRAILQRS